MAAWETLFTAAGLLKLASNTTMLLMVLAMMVITGLIRAKGTFEPIGDVLFRWFRNKKLLICCLAAAFQPLPNRTLFTAAILEGMADPTRDRTKLAVLAYITTHHYYLWSPIERSLVIVMAGLHLSYAAVMGYMVVPLVAYFLFMAVYIVAFVREADLGDLRPSGRAGPVQWRKLADVAVLLVLIGVNAVGVVPPVTLQHVTFNGLTWSTALFAGYLCLLHRPTVRDLNGYIRWPFFGVAFGAILFGWAMDAYSTVLMDYVTSVTLSVGLAAAMAVGFAASFAFGKSARYAAITILLCNVFGVQYFLLFYAAELGGFLLSPAHHSLVVVQQYFNARPVPYYATVAMLSLTLIAAAGLSLVV